MLTTTKVVYIETRQLFGVTNITGPAYIHQQADKLNSKTFSEEIKNQIMKDKNRAVRSL